MEAVVQQAAVATERLSRQNESLVAKRFSITHMQFPVVGRNDPGRKAKLKQWDEQRRLRLLRYCVMMELLDIYGTEDDQEEDVEQIVETVVEKDVDKAEAVVQQEAMEVVEEKEHVAEAEAVMDTEDMVQLATVVEQVVVQETEAVEEIVETMEETVGPVQAALASLARRRERQQREREDEPEVKSDGEYEFAQTIRRVVVKAVVEKQEEKEDVEETDVESVVEAVSLGAPWELWSMWQGAELSVASDEEPVETVETDSEGDVWAGLQSEQSSESRECKQWSEAKASSV